MIRGDGRAFIDPVLGFDEFQQTRVLDEFAGFLRVVVAGKFDDDPARQGDLDDGLAHTECVYAVLDDSGGDVQRFDGDGLIRRKVGLQQNLLPALEVQALANARLLAEYQDVLWYVDDQDRNRHEDDSNPSYGPTHSIFLQTAKYLPRQKRPSPVQADADIISSGRFISRAAVQTA